MFVTNAKIKKDKGYTLIYQHDPHCKESEFSIGFLGGRNFDGIYPGLTHLIEHLFYTRENLQETEKLIDLFAEYFIDITGYTDENIIHLDARTLDETFDKAFPLTFDCLMNEKFSKKQIKNELEVLLLEKYARDEDDDEIDDTLFDTFIEKIKIEEEKNYFDNIRKMKQEIAPEDIRDFKRKYFNKENFILSIKTNRPIEEIERLCDENISKYIPEAKCTDYIAQLPSQPYYKNKNEKIAIEDEYVSNVKINIILRERLSNSDNPAFEKAIDLIENLYMGNDNSVLYKKLRLENQLAYSFNSSNEDYGTSKFKLLSVITIRRKYLKTLNVLMKDVIGELAKNGISKKDFEVAKHNLVGDIEAGDIEFEDADELCVNYSKGSLPVEREKLNNEIKNMTYEKFNNYIKSVYRKCDVSYTIEGDIDEKKCPSLVELQQMTGITDGMEDLSKKECAEEKFEETELEEE